MLVTDLVQDLRAWGPCDVRTAGDVDILDILDVEHDSRLVRSGGLFVALVGQSHDGHDFAPAALAAGASALLVEQWLDLDVSQIRVDDTRRSMPLAAAAVHGHPSRELKVMGVTGTNGKTTTTQMLASILRAAGHRTETIGTLSGGHTTPEATVLQRRLRAWADDDVDAVVMEVSSHALEQGRVDALTFAVAAFSNLTPDHLDHHGDMTSYFEAKARLFDGRAGHELINVDDQWGARLAELRPDAVRLSLDDIAIGAMDLAGSTFNWRGTTLRVPLAGRMNIENALMAAEMARAADVAPDDIKAGLALLGQVRGRMEVAVSGDHVPTVIVDYSHTPDSIRHALATIRTVQPTGVLTIVFGCGGDRDRAKRPLMTARAEAGADVVWLTSDNPRSEPPEEIIADALEGAVDPSQVRVEPDRRAAIAGAIAAAAPGDVVLIAGKGHETTQTIGDAVLDFDDVAVARECAQGVTR